jgi:hypothetical protein
MNARNANPPNKACILFTTPPRLPRLQSEKTSSDMSVYSVIILFFAATFFN